MKQEKRFVVDILFVLALFGVFTVSALMLSTIGAEVYRRTTKDMSDNYEARTSVVYLTEKIRQNDSLARTPEGTSEENIQISTLAGIPALKIFQEFNGETYITYLYLHEGYLKELFVRADGDLGGDPLTAGQNIMELSDFSMAKVSDNLLSLTLTTSDQKKYRIYSGLRCTP